MNVAASWFDALGHPVSAHRFNETLTLLVEEGFDPGETSLVLQVVAREIRHDNPDRAFAYMTSHLGKQNLTLVYRSLATMTAPTTADLADDLKSMKEELQPKP